MAPRADAHIQQCDRVQALLSGLRPPVQLTVQAANPRLGRRPGVVRHQRHHCWRSADRFQMVGPVQRVEPCRGHVRGVSDVIEPRGEHDLFGDPAEPS